MPSGIYVRTEEIKRKNSESKIGKSNGREGLHHSEETKRKISESKKGIIVWNKGLTKETDERVKMYVEKGSKPRKQETKENIRQARIRTMEQQLKNGTINWMNTDIEMLMYEGLLSEGYLITKQYYIKGVCRVDFYFPEYNIVIECDGDYWHNNLKSFEIDQNRTNKMEASGYKVLRFKGSEIKKNLQKCLNRIKEVI
jgi:very-short-patch-repair endonuclease